MSTLLHRNQMASSSISASISIQNARKNHHSHSHSRINDEYKYDPEVSKSAQVLYDTATWRMYYRIINGRKRRDQIAQDVSDGGSARLPSRSRDAQQESESFSRANANAKAPSKGLSKRNDQTLSLSYCSVDGFSLRDEGIFTLDL